MAGTRHTEHMRSEIAVGLRYRGIRPGYAVLHVTTGAALGLAGFILLTTLGSLTVGLLPTVVGALVTGILLYAANAVIAALHRSRLRAFLGLHITPPDAPRASGFVANIKATLTTAPFWKALVYNGLVGLGMFVLGTVVMALLVAGLVCLVSPISGTPVNLGPLGTSTQSLGVMVLAVLLGTALVLLVAPAARVVALLDGALAVALLGRPATEVLVERVEHLAQARTGTVDAADAERRRIERDLHDGTQQRLTALAMNLGVARATLPDLSPPARAALDQAHADAKAALVELRGIVRGLHPAVLDDRGLDAALRGSPLAPPCRSPSTCTCPAGCRPPSKRSPTSSSPRR